MHLMGIPFVFGRKLTLIMVIWKEREHELNELQEANDLMNVRALKECGLLKYFRVPEMRAYVRLLEYLIHMWDPDQQHFWVGTHTLTIDVKDIYFLTGLSQRRSPIVLTGPRGGEISMDDLIDEYCAVGTRSQGGKIPIKHIVDCR